MSLSHFSVLLFFIFLATKDSNLEAAIVLKSVSRLLFFLRFLFSKHNGKMNKSLNLFCFLVFFFPRQSKAFSDRELFLFYNFQIKDIALKASGAYKNCKPCSGSSNHNRNYADSDSARLHCPYRRTGSMNSTPRIRGKEMESRLKGLSSGEGTPASVSGRTESVVFMEEDEPKEWVAQVEPGVFITFVSLPEGGNDLKRIRFR